MQKIGLNNGPSNLDVSACDSHLFGPLREAVEWQRFEDDSGVEMFVRN